MGPSSWASGGAGYPLLHDLVVHRNNLYTVAWAKTDKFGTVYTLKCLDGKPGPQTRQIRRPNPLEFLTWSLRD